MKKDPSTLRSRQWFANPDPPNMTALYLERYMNWGLTREELQAGKPIIGIAQSGSPSPGHCNTMGTASTMNSLAEALGMSLPGCAAIPAPHKERAVIAYQSGNGDGRQSGTSGSPSILNASPEAASMGGLAILKTGDRVRIDLNQRTANILISKAEYPRRMKALVKQGGFKSPASQTPWQEIQRGMVDELSNGMVLKPAVKYQRIDQTMGVPRDNH